MARCRRGSPRSSARSRAAGAARGSSPGASGSRARSAPRSPARTTGVVRSPASATRPRGSWCSGWRPPPTARTAPAASSPATAPATSCSRRLHRAGPRQPADSRSTPSDGLRLTGAWVTAAVRCAPPANKPTPAERDACLPWTVAELALLPRGARRSLCLGALAWDAALRLRAAAGHDGAASPAALRPRRARRADRGPALLGCFHPSQQNTFTGRLTAPMLDAVLRREARAIATPRA